VIRTIESRRVDLGLAPLDALRAWPQDLPAAALVSGVAGDGFRSRWSIIARPGPWTLVDGRGPIVPGAECMAAPREHGAGGPAFTGGWIGFLTYELGGMLEPRAAGRRSAAGAGAPLGGWARCESAYVHDNLTGEWWTVGDSGELPDPDDLRGRAEIAADAGQPRRFSFEGPLRSESGREAYVRAVARAVEYIRAGDVFQVNLAHTLKGRMRGSPRDLFAALVSSASPWYGALLETPWGVIASASPELFLDYDAASRRAVTRPMKGTRAGERTAAELLASEKDAAELNMIVDLMRNDLGRVSEFGSVRVETPREVESHGAVNGAAQRGGGVLQGVATISGVVRAAVGLDGLMRAAFPPGSITGAPKVRAMQIIDESEAAPRGTYCGCVGFVSDSGRAEFSVAIRTAMLERVSGESRGVNAHAQGSAAARGDLWEVRYGVGAGIVADSDPESEWRETLVKARVWQGVAHVAED